THIADARDLAGRYATPEDRSRIIAKWATLPPEKRKGGISILFDGTDRGDRPVLPATGDLPEGVHLYNGEFEAESTRIEPNSADLVYIDIVWGDADMARNAAKVAHRILRPGG